MEKHLVISVRELGVSDRINVKMVESAAHAKARNVHVLSSAKYSIEGKSVSMSCTRALRNPS